jgi:hypothetical protein
MGLSRIPMARNRRVTAAPSILIGAIPTAVHSTTRIDQPMVREGWLARGQGNAWS